MRTLVLEDRAYLLSRGYTEELLGREEFWSIGTGDRPFYDAPPTKQPMIATECKGPDGTVAGVHLLCRLQKDYQYHTKEPDLPPFYGTPEDWSQFFNTGEMTIGEGIFDRIALKRATPNHATFARLSKGFPRGLTILAKIYAKKVWLAFDEDLPGEKAAEQAARSLGGDVETHRLHFFRNDPAAVLKKDGLQKLTKLIIDQRELLSP